MRRNFRTGNNHDIPSHVFDINLGFISPPPPHPPPPLLKITARCAPALAPPPTTAAMYFQPSVGSIVKISPSLFFRELSGFIKKPQCRLKLWAADARLLISGLQDLCVNLPMEIRPAAIVAAAALTSFICSLEIVWRSCSSSKRASLFCFSEPLSLFELCVTL